MSDTIAKKIHALLTKAERTDFPEEAEAFSAKAAELMAKYAIEEADLLSLSGAGSSAIRIEYRRYTVGMPYSMDRMYLVYHVADALGGHSYYFKQPRDGSKTRVRSKDHNTYATIIGTSSDIDNIETMIASLNKQMERERYRVQQEVDYLSMGKKKVWNATFIRAYAQRIGQRLKESYEATLEQATGGAALMIRDKKQLIRDELNKMGIKATSSSRQYSSDGAHYGRAAADRARLREALE